MIETATMDRSEDGLALYERAVLLEARGHAAAALVLFDEAYEELRDDAILFDRLRCVLRVGRREDFQETAARLAAKYGPVAEKAAVRIALEAGPSGAVPAWLRPANPERAGNPAAS